VIRCRLTPLTRFILAAALLAAMPSDGQLPAAHNPPQPASAPGNPATAAKALTPAEFAARLSVFEQLAAACQAASGPDHCMASQIDPVLPIQLPSGARQVRFNWLRALFDEAAHPLKAEAKPETKPKQPASDSAEDSLPVDPLPPIGARLAAARARLAADRAQILSLTAQPSAPSASSSSSSSSSSSGSFSSPGSANSHRSLLAAILAGKDYNSIQPTRSLRDRVLEKIQQWILRFFGALSQAGRGKRWIGITVEAVFIVLLLTGLLWFLLRLERQGRLVNASFAPGLGTPSARDWQLWLDDARRAASHGAWRDAVHFLYWSSISRMESSGLWPADRARTPREYLALLAPSHTQRSALLALTRTFERTWYAGRPATESDFREAEQQATQLAARHSSLRQQPGEAGRS
jgi:hypothetical protein